MSSMALATRTASSGLSSFTHIPAGVALEGCAARVPRNSPTGTRTGSRRRPHAGAVIDAVKIELPGARAAINGRFDGDAVADFPAKALGGVRAGDGALAVLDEVLPLVIGNDQLGDDLALIFHVDHELREEVLFVLIDAAEPIVVGDAP